MPDTFGVDLGNLSEQYGVDYDEKTHTWRILDFKHPAAATLKRGEMVDDDHPALTVITEIMFAKLVKEATNLGVLSPSVIGVEQNNINTEELVKELERLNTENNVLENKLKELKDSAEVEREDSESFKLKSKVIDVLRGIAIAEDIVNETSK